MTHWKAKSLDLSPILTPAKKPHADVQTYCTIEQNHALDTVRDMELLQKCGPALQERKHVRIDTTIKNTDRAFGTILSNEVSRAACANGLPADTIHIKAKGLRGRVLVRGWRMGSPLKSKVTPMTTPGRVCPAVV